MKDKKEILKAQIEMLEKLSSEYASSCSEGSGDPKQRGYILLSKILDYLSNKRSQLKDLEKEE